MIFRGGFSVFSPQEILYTHIANGVLLAKLANVRGHSVLPHGVRVAVSAVGVDACDRRVGWLVLSGAMEHIHTTTTMCGLPLPRLHEAQTAFEQQKWTN